MLDDVFTYKAGLGALQVQLADYISATPAGCSVALQRERVPATAAEHERLKPVSLEHCVSDALQKEVVLEFPVFVVSLESTCHEHPAASGIALSAQAGVQSSALCSQEAKAPLLQHET